MTSIFDKTTRDGIIARIKALDVNSKAQWGKMNVYQMMEHCARWEEMIAGRLNSKRSFLGRIFGKMALKDFLKEDKPLRMNSPTIPELIVKETSGDMQAEKAKWIALIEENANFSAPVFVHPFFGEMTKDEIGCLAYRHLDHHLRQFNG